MVSRVRASIQKPVSVCSTLLQDACCRADRRCKLLVRKWSLNHFDNSWALSKQCQETQDKRVINFLKSLNLETTELKNEKKILLDKNFEITCVKSGFYDSALLVEIDDRKIFNLNDCPIETIDEIIRYETLTLEEIQKAVNIVKSNYVFNLETSSQLSSFFGNELLWGRKSSLDCLNKYLNYWNDLDNFKEITKYIQEDKFTLIASPNKW